MLNPSSYYNFDFDNLYACKSLKTAIKRAKKDIEQLKGDAEYLSLDIDILEQHFKTNDTYKVIEPNNYMIVIEYESLTEQWYINLKYNN